MQEKERVENVFQGRRANATLVHIKMANDMLVAGDKISKLSVRLGWLGAILGVLSLLLGIISLLEMLNLLKSSVHIKAKRRWK